MGGKVLRYQGTGGLKGTKQELEALLHTSRDKTAHYLMPILLYWGGLREYLDPYEQWGMYAPVPRRQLPTIEAHLHHLTLMYDAIGAPYDLELTIEPREDNVVLLFKDHREDTTLLSTQERGTRFSYPQCCVEQFTAGMKAGGRMAEAYWKKVVNEKALVQAFDAYRLHVPCKVDCEQTEQQLRRYGQYVRSEFPSIADSFEKDSKEFWTWVHEKYS